MATPKTATTDGGDAGERLAQRERRRRGFQARRGTDGVGIARRSRVAREQFEQRGQLRTAADAARERWATRRRRRADGNASTCRETRSSRDSVR